MKLPRVSDHGSEIALLALIATGVVGLAAVAYLHGHSAEGAAWSTVLMAIINAIKERWTQRSVDRMGQQLGGSAPAPDPPSKTTVEGER